MFISLFENIKRVLALEHLPEDPAFRTGVRPNFNLLIRANDILI
jgi:hypothetical protein